MFEQFATLIIILLLSGILSYEQETRVTEPITVENADRLEETAVLGRGFASSLDWKPDGKLLAVGSPTGIWLLDEELEIVEQIPVEEHITNLKWSPDGSMIAVVGNLPGKCTIQVWDASFMEQRLKLNDCGSQALWNATGTHLAVFDPIILNTEMLLINLRTNEVEMLPGRSGAWSPSGNLLFTILSSPTLMLDVSPMLYTWEVNTTEIEQVFALDMSNLYLGEILQGVDNRTLAFQCNDIQEDPEKISVGLCHLDVRTGQITLLQKLRSYLYGQGITLRSLAWNEDETLLAAVHDISTSGFLNSIQLFDIESEEFVRIGDGTLFDWKPNTYHLTVVVGNGEIHTYDVRTGEITAKSWYFTGSVNSVAIHPNNDKIASTGFGYEQKINIWDLHDSSDDPVLSLEVEPAEIVSYMPDGSELIVGGTMTTDIVENQQIDAVDPYTGEHIRNIASYYGQGILPVRRYWNANYSKFVEVDDEGLITLSNDNVIKTEDSLVDVLWSPDDSFIATVEKIPADYSFKIRTWNTTTGEHINTFDGGMYSFRGMVWSPTGKQIIVLLEHTTGSDTYLRGFRVFTVVSGENYEFDRHDYQEFAAVNIYESDQQAKATWNSDGTMLAVVLPDVLVVYNLQQEENSLISLPVYDIVDLKWSSDDRFIVGGSGDGTIRVWSVSPANLK